MPTPWFIPLLRLIYRALWWLSAPVAVIRLLWRSRREPGYRRHIAERFGFGPARRAALASGESSESSESSQASAGSAVAASAAWALPPLIWVHAVSVGETRAAEPLIAALRAAYPGAELLITHMTPGGRATSEQMFGDRVLRAYLPYDMPGAVRRFLRRYRPVLGVVMETEVWPTLIDECQRARVPLVLANARMSERSFGRAQRFGRAAHSVFSGFSAVLTQTDADAHRLEALGARRVSVCGNLKFDMPIDAGLLDTGTRWRMAIGDRPVWVAASTREGEEALVLDAFAQQLTRGPSDALLILVPRHPQRFGEVYTLANKTFRTERRSDWALNLSAASGNGTDADLSAGALDASSRRAPLSELGTDVQVLLGDSMGELIAYYAASDLAFIGGSLVNTGGQNLIEAAATGTPVIVGPHTFNFTRASADAIDAGAAIRVPSPQALGEAVAALLSDDVKREGMGMAARAFANRDRGATARMVEALSAFMPTQ